MSAILECIPNVSEGKNASVLQALAHVIQSQPDVYLLHQDPGFSAHRSVFTFAGAPQAVVEAAFQLIKAASQRIDMRQHQGTHPRMGATDVCPLVPIQGISMEEAVRWANKLGQRVGDELGIPVYLYEHAATQPKRRNLANIRAGEYEGFREKIYQDAWKPDYGPQTFHPQAGQTVIGARPFLIAYNLNLNTKSAALAHEIACDIRESGRVKKQEGKILRDASGKKIRIPGTCKAVKAIGWFIEEYGCAQVSTNLTEIDKTPLHVLYEAAVAAAQARGIQVTGSELIGMLPQRCLLEAGRHFSQGKESDPQRLEALAIQHMGLDELAPFIPQERVIEHKLRALTQQER